MTKLTEDDLNRLDRQLDAAITSLPLLTRPNDEALLHLLSSFEGFYHWWGNEMERSSTNGDWPTNSRNPQDGLQFASQWIYRYCPLPAPRKRYKLKHKIGIEATELHTVALNYAQIWNVMTTLHKGWTEAEWGGENKIIVHKSARPGPDNTMADTFLNAADPPESLQAASRRQRASKAEGLIRAYGKNNILQQRQQLAYSLNFIQALSLVFDEGQEHLWELDASWDLGDYTIGEFRKLWSCLVAFAYLEHVLGSLGSETSALPPIGSRPHWTKRLSRHSGLPSPTVEAILDDITFDPNRANRRQVAIDISIQPFFPLFEDVLVCSFPLVMLSNPERNIWSVINVRRPDVHSRIRNQKQAVQVHRLKMKASSLGLSCVGPIKFPGGDLDLLVLDTAHRFGLCCQLKWFNAPDWLSQVIRVEEELQAGLKQAKTSLGWIRSEMAKETLQRVVTGDPDLGDVVKNELLAVDLGQYHLEAIVISANSMGSGFAFDPDVPILSERMLHWIIGEPHRKSLETAWRVGKEQRWRFEEGRHYFRSDLEVKFGSVTFVTIGQGITPGAPWNPETGFDFSNLE